MNFPIGLLRESEEERWRVAIAIGDSLPDNAEYCLECAILCCEHENADIRTMGATCLLEHVFEHSFDMAYVECLSRIKNGNVNMCRSFLLCSPFGATLLPANLSRFNNLREIAAAVIKTNGQGTKGKPVQRGQDYHESDK